MSKLTASQCSTNSNCSKQGSMVMEINIPEIVREVTNAFERYEGALSNNDLDTIDSLPP